MGGFGDVDVLPLMSKVLSSVSPNCESPTEHGSQRKTKPELRSHLPSIKPFIVLVELLVDFGSGDFELLV